MINGAGNQISAPDGSGFDWFKLTRKGQVLSAFISNDGKTWKMIQTFTLPTTAGGRYQVHQMGDQIEVGFIHYALPSPTPRIHWAQFDHISISDDAK